MKKIIFIITIFLLTFTLIACKKNEKVNNTFITLDEQSLKVAAYLELKPIAIGLIKDEALKQKYSGIPSFATIDESAIAQIEKLAPGYLFIDSAILSKYETILTPLKKTKIKLEALDYYSVIDLKHSIQHMASIYACGTKVRPYLKETLNKEKELKTKYQEVIKYKRQIVFIYGDESNIEQIATKNSYVGYLAHKLDILNLANQITPEEKPYLTDYKKNLYKYDTVKPDYFIFLIENNNDELITKYDALLKTTEYANLQVIKQNKVVYFKSSHLLGKAQINYLTLFEELVDFLIALP